MDQLLKLCLAGLAALIGALFAARAGVSILTVFFVALPFPMAIGGENSPANISASDVLIGVATVTLLSRSRFRMGGAGLAVLAFLLMATVSSVLASEVREIILGLGRMALVTLVPVLVFANSADPLRELRRGLIAYCLSATVLAGFSLAAFATGGIEASMYTLGIHKNALGPIFGTAVVAAFAALTTGTFRDRRAVAATFGVLAACGVGLLLTLSRSGWAGTLAGLTVILLLTGRVKPALSGAAMLVPVLMVVWSRLPKDKVEYATNVSTDSHTVQQRFGTIAETLDEFRTNPVLGVGIGLERRVEPHNVLILTLGETGIAGVVAFATMVAVGAGTLLAAGRRLRAGDPSYGLIVAGLASFAVYHVQTLADVYWRRGVGALSWACVGVAVAVTSEVVRPRPGASTGRRPHPSLPPQPLA